MRKDFHAVSECLHQMAFPHISCSPALAPGAVCCVKLGRGSSCPVQLGFFYGSWSTGSDFTMSGSGSFCNANLFPGAVAECHLALLKQLLVCRGECWAAVASLRGALNHQLLRFTQHLEPACCYKEWGVSVNPSATRTGAASPQFSKGGIIY